MLHSDCFVPWARCPKKLRNDIKLSLKKCKGSLFKVFLEYALFFNINYGPANTKKWIAKEATRSKGIHEKLRL